MKKLSARKRATDWAAIGDAVQQRDKRAVGYGAQVFAMRMGDQTFSG